MNTPLADKGRADFLASKKDASLYDDATNGADYRRGWQLARLDQGNAIGGRDPKAATQAPAETASPRTEPAVSAPRPSKKPKAASKKTDASQSELF